MAYRPMGTRPPTYDELIAQMGMSSPATTSNLSNLGSSISSTVNSRLAGNNYYTPPPTYSPTTSRLDAYHAQQGDDLSGLGDRIRTDVRSRLDRHPAMISLNEMQISRPPSFPELSRATTLLERPSPDLGDSIRARVEASLGMRPSPSYQPPPFGGEASMGPEWQRQTYDTVLTDDPYARRTYRVGLAGNPPAPTRPEPSRQMIREPAWGEEARQRYPAAIEQTPVATTGSASISFPKPPGREATTTPPRISNIRGSAAPRIDEMSGTALQPSTIAVPTPTMGSAQGPLPEGLQIAYGRGGTWDEVNQYDPLFQQYGEQYGVDPHMLKAMAVIESGGQMIPNGNGFPNYGIMQLTSQQFGAGYYTPWDQAADTLGVDINSAEGQIAIAAYVLGGGQGDQGTPEEIFLSKYYPTPCLDCPGQDGHTPRQYLSDMEILRGVSAGAGMGGQPQQMAQMAPRQQEVDAPQPTAPTGQTGAPGGDWATLDQYNPSYDRAASQLQQEYGIPIDGNVIKSMQAIESGYGNVNGPADQNCTIRPEAGCLHVWTGVFEATAASRGVDYQRMVSDPDYAVYAMGKVISEIAMDPSSMWGGAGQGTLLEDHGWEGVAAVYFSGQLGDQWADELGTNAGAYKQSFNEKYAQLSGASQQGQQVASSMSETPAAVAVLPNDGSVPPTPETTGTSDPTGNAIVGALQQYLGTPYVYGGLSPETGWDCSGFLYWADQNHGNGDIPAGSHEQYDFAVTNGLLKNDPSQLAVGDAVFFDTGFSYRNNGASHVAIYVGDGKIMHAENAGTGTVISDLATYLNLYPYLGGASLL